MSRRKRGTEMNDLQKEIYRKGYIAGYRDGLRAAKEGRIPQVNGSVAEVPIQAMDISTRAKNCLLMAGCLHVADVIALDEKRIATMRNLGVKTLAEICHWLEKNGVHDSAWSRIISL
jgi:DNA-directed RNA polymerase alpha subunit